LDVRSHAQLHSPVPTGSTRTAEAFSTGWVLPTPHTPGVTAILFPTVPRVIYQVFFPPEGFIIFMILYYVILHYFYLPGPTVHGTHIWLRHFC